MVIQKAVRAGDMTALEEGRSDRPPPGLARHFESFKLNDVDKYYDATDEEEEDEFFPALSRATSESHLGQMLDALEHGRCEEDVLLRSSF